MHHEHRQNQKIRYSNAASHPNKGVKVAKVIGQNPDFQVDCTNCGAKVEFERSDVRAGEQMAHSMDRDHRSVITCPKCGKPIDVTFKFGRTSYESAQEQARHDI